MRDTLNIRKLRESRGYSQEYMAYRLGVSQPTYFRIEKNIYLTSFQNISNIALILETEVLELIKCL